MGDEYWEIYATELSGTYSLFDWLMVSKEQQLAIPVREQEMINWCLEFCGEQGDRWNWAVGIGYMFAVSPSWMPGAHNVGDHDLEDIRPDDIIFVFYNEEDAIQFKLVWN